MVGDDPHGWWACLEGVPDPEIPVISIVDLGVVRDIRQGEHGIDVDLSPTYTGCPAMDMMAEDVQKSLAEKTTVCCLGPKNAKKPHPSLRHFFEGYES